MESTKIIFARFVFRSEIVFMFVPVQYSALVLYTRSSILGKQLAAGLFGNDKRINAV